MLVDSETRDALAGAVWHGAGFGRVEMEAFVFDNLWHERVQGLRNAGIAGEREVVSVAAVVCAEASGEG